VPELDEPELARVRLDSWVAATHRYCSERLRIDLQTLVCREGLVVVTPTHLDLLQPLAAVDLTVRRHALDSDPGWLPWLGRVVSFRYLDESELRDSALNTARV
jgi:hypothetical protein